MSNNTTAQLRDLKEGEEIDLEIDDEEYTGTVVEITHDPFGRDDTGVPIPGSLDLEIELDNETVERTDVRTQSLSISMIEEGEDEFTSPVVDVWDPKVDEEGTFVTDDWMVLGEIQSVERETDGDS